MINGKTYEDIINMERPVSKKYPEPDMETRAAQFSPFAALTGLEDAIEDTGKAAVKRVLDSEKNEKFYDCPLD